MGRIHRLALGGIVGLAAVLGVVALGMTADLGIGVPSDPPALAASRAGETVDADAARRDVEAARAEFARALAERAAAPGATAVAAPDPGWSAEAEEREHEEYEEHEDHEDHEEHEERGYAEDRGEHGEDD